MLSYRVICDNGINAAEAQTYQELLSLLRLSPETVGRLEAAALEDSWS
jgi:hypothetical protein